jgi:hypothetical protein
LKKPSLTSFVIVYVKALEAAYGGSDQPNLSLLPLFTPPRFRIYNPIRSAAVIACLSRRLSSAASRPSALSPCFGCVVLEVGALDGLGCPVPTSEVVLALRFSSSAWSNLTSEARSGIAVGFDLIMMEV